MTNPPNLRAGTVASTTLATLFDQGEGQHYRRESVVDIFTLVPVSEAWITPSITSATMTTFVCQQCKEPLQVSSTHSYHIYPKLIPEIS